MSADQWYLDRLRAELERVAALEDRRERRAAPAWLRLPPRGALAAALAVIVVVAAVAIGIALVAGSEDERTAAPAPTPAPTTPAEAALQRLDGVYIAQITPQTIARMGIKLPPSPGLWRLTIHGAELDFILSGPEGSDTGDYTMKITGAGRSRLAIAPDPACEIPAERSAPGSVAYELHGAMLTLRGARGGCTPTWTVLTSAEWRKA